jgi:hypothetical protein
MQNEDLVSFVKSLSSRELSSKEVGYLLQYDTLKRKLDDGVLMEQGHIAGTYNGYICSICACSRAKWRCDKCKHYFCMDHMNNNDELCDNCDNCLPKCDSCGSKTEDIELRTCTSCNFHLCRSCDETLFLDKTVCLDCNPE